MLKQNPNIALLDTEIIVNAPVRLLVSGMGDALATFFEARAYNIRSNSLNLSDGHASLAAFTLAKLYYGTLISDGYKAKLACESKVSENAPNTEIQEVVDFCKKVGLPTTLKDLGINEVNKDDIVRVAEASCEPNETIDAMPFKVTAYDVYAAILTADRLSR